MTGKITEQQFQDLLRMITTVAELEARKAYCDLIDTDTETEQMVADNAVDAAKESLVQTRTADEQNNTYKNRLKVCQQHLKDARNEIDRLRVANSMCKQHHETLHKVAEGLGLAPGEDVTDKILPRLYKLMESLNDTRAVLETEQDAHAEVAAERDRLKTTVQALRKALQALGE